MIKCTEYFPGTHIVSECIFSSVTVSRLQPGMPLDLSESQFPQGKDRLGLGVSSSSESCPLGTHGIGYFFNEKKKKKRLVKSE